MSIYQKYLKDENGEVFSPIVSSNSVYYEKGSVLITNTNTPPNQLGNWELIDKEFTTKVESVALNIDSANVSAANLYCTWSGHTIYCFLNVDTKTTMNDNTIHLGTLPLAKLGITFLPHNYNRIIGGSDGGNSASLINITTEGDVSSVETLIKSGASYPTNQTFSYHMTFVIPHGQMSNSFCNKFYWRKTT